MIRFIRGDLFTSKAQTLVNDVNCDGVMPTGIAHEFRERWPSIFFAYQDACLRGQVTIGFPFLFRLEDRQVLNVPTRQRWKAPASYEFVDAGLVAIRNRYSEWGIESLALPALGCDGGLEWTRVRNLIEDCLGSLPLVIEAYEPFEAEDEASPG